MRKPSCGWRGTCAMSATAVVTGGPAVATRYVPRPHPELPKFAVNARRTPQRIRRGYLDDQSPQLRIQRWASGTVAAGATRPPSAEPLAMPADDGLGLHEDEGRPPAPPRAGQQDPEHPVTRTKPMLRNAALQRSQLVAQGHVLQEKIATPAADEADRPDDQQQQFEHRLILACALGEINPV